jgi:hypothetical protein
MAGEALMARKLQPCGTRGAFMRHYREGLRGDEIDAACREANSAYARNRYANSYKEQHSLYAGAQWRARRDLSERYPDEYEELFHQYLDELSRDTK